jgi:hypothetical protein
MGSIFDGLNTALLHAVFDYHVNMVFNPCMSPKPDADLIATLGGPTRVADLLGLPKRGGAQRVQNWLYRGIPSAVKCKRPDLFMPELATPQPTTAQEGQGV